MWKIDIIVGNINNLDIMTNYTEKLPIISKQEEWVLHWLSASNDMSIHLVVVAAVEGIFFSSSWVVCSILQQNGFSANITALNNELHEHGLSSDFACLLHSQLIKKCNPTQILTIITEAVSLAQEFATVTLPSKLNRHLHTVMRNIEDKADLLLIALGVEPFYKK